MMQKPTVNQKVIHLTLSCTLSLGVSQQQKTTHRLTYVYLLYTFINFTLRVFDQDIRMSIYCITSFVGKMSVTLLIVNSSSYQIHTLLHLIIIRAKIMTTYCHIISNLGEVLKSNLGVETSICGNFNYFR